MIAAVGGNLIPVVVGALALVFYSEPAVQQCFAMLQSSYSKRM